MRKRMKLPNPEAHKKFVVSFCNKGNIQVNFVPKLKVPFASVSKSGVATLTLREPVATDLVSPELWDWDAHHEASHLLPELRFCYEALLLCKNNLEQTVLNILADNICERARHGQYRGHDRIMYQGRYKFTIDNLDKVMCRNHPALSALFSLDFVDRRTWQGAYPVLEPMKGADVYLKDFESMGVFKMIPQIMKQEDGQEFYDLIMEIVKLIKQPPPPPPQEPDNNPDDSDGDQDDNPEECSGDASGCTNDSDSGDQEEGGSGPEEEGPEVEDDSGGVKGTDDPEDSDNTEDSGGGAGDSSDDGNSEGSSDSTKPGSDNGNSSADSRTPVDENVMDIPDEFQPMIKPGAYTPEEKSSGNYTNIGGTKWVKFDRELKLSNREAIEKLIKCSPISKQVQKFFKIMAKDKYQYGMKKGKIHGKNLYRLYAQGADQPRVFKQKNVHRLKTDTAISLMVDCSGSMNSRNKYITAAACCILIAETLTDLRIPHEIVGFTEAGSMKMYPFKYFNEHYKRGLLLDRFSSSSVYRGYTPDAEALVMIASRLNERKENNKLLIALSDGSPEGNCNRNGSDGCWYLREVCRLLDESDINLIGIGIMDSSVKSFYKNCVVIKRPSELEAVLIEALQRTLI